MLSYICECVVRTLHKCFAKSRLGGFLRIGRSRVIINPGLYQMMATVVLTLNLNILFGALTRRHHWAQRNKAI